MPKNKIVVENVYELKKILMLEYDKGDVDDSDRLVDLNHIDVSKVKSFDYLFRNLYLTNVDVSNWDVSGAESMQGMFMDSNLNIDLSKWNVSNVCNMGSMFEGSKFNSVISTWDTSQVTDMSRMFYCAIFTQDISNWDVSRVENVSEMFTLSRFHGDLSRWDVRAVKNNYDIFGGVERNIVSPDFRDGMLKSGLFFY